MISGIIKVEVSLISRSEGRNIREGDHSLFSAITVYFTVYFQTLKNVQLSNKQIFTVFIKEIMHCARNLQIIH